MVKCGRYGFSILVMSLFMICGKVFAGPDTTNIFAAKLYPTGHGNDQQQVRGGSYLNLSELALAEENYRIGRRLYKEEAEYDSAFAYIETAGYYFEEAGDWESYCRCLLDICDYYCTKVKYDKAQEYLDAAEAFAGKYFDGYHILYSEIYYAKGKLSLLKGNKKSAIEYLEESIKLRINLKGSNDQELATVYNTLGVSFYYIGQLDKALEILNRALEVKISAISKDDIKVAEIYNNIGIVLKLKGDIPGALDNYTKALKIKERVLNPNDPNLAVTYNNLGNLYRMIGKADEAMVYYEKAVEINKSKFGSKHPSIGRIYDNMGIVYKNSGDYVKALEYFDQSLKMFDKTNDAQEISSVYNNMGTVYYDHGEYEKALHFYRESVAIREKYEYSLMITKSYTNYANCYNELGELDLADKYFKLSINSLIKFFGVEHYQLGSAYMNYGRFCIERGEKQLGLNYFQKGYSIFSINYGEKHSTVSSCLSEIGNYFLLENNQIEALNYYQKALVAVAKNFNDKYNFYTNPVIQDGIISNNYLLEALKGKAKALKSYYSSTHNIRDIEMSLKTYELAINLVDIIRIDHQDQESKLELAKNQKDLFSEAISVALEVFNKTQDPKYRDAAFEIAEKGKAGMLYDFIRESDAKHYAHIPDSILNVERKVKENITLYENLLYEELSNINAERDSAKITFWNDQLFQLKNQQKDIVEYLNANYPKYYQYKYNNKIYSLDEIQSYINKEDVLIEYFLGEKSMFVFIVTNDNIRVEEKPIDPELYADIDNLPNNQSLELVINESYPTFVNYVSSSYNLYHTLLEPYEKDTKDKNLVIIPDGRLGYVSFESLLTIPVNTDVVDYRNLPYLLNDHAVSYGYSSTLLMNSRNKIHQGKASQDLLAFAPVMFNLSSQSSVNPANGTRNRARNDQMLDLPGTRKEVEGIGKIINCDIYMNEQATVSKFKEIAGNYKILHIATHGIVDNQNPVHSRLMFSPVSSQTDGGYLQYNDLFNLELNADLAVLSACNTGYGHNSEGEGIIALSRGFLYSGVPSLVISLWKVEDESTAAIMKSFYKYLKDGYSKDESLRKAKLDYLKTTDNLGSSPYYWSGFVNIGNKEPLDLGNNKLNFLWLLLLLIPVPGYLFHLHRKKARLIAG